MKNQTFKTAILTVGVMIMGVSGSLADDMLTISGTISEIFGHRMVVEQGGKKYLVHVGPKISEIGAMSAGAKVTVAGEMKKSGEVRAFEITPPDGKLVEVSKDKQTWTEWLLGDDKDDGRPFTSEDARSIAAKNGYALDGGVTAEKKHFTGTAIKDGKPVEIEIHRDGSVKERIDFTIEAAKKFLSDKKTEIIGELKAVKKHYEAMIVRDGKPVSVEVHRDGSVRDAPGRN